VIREARAADLAPIAGIAIGAGQQDDWSGRGPLDPRRAVPSPGQA
jgi:hypothetical protein